MGWAEVAFDLDERSEPGGAAELESREVDHDGRLGWRRCGPVDDVTYEAVGGGVGVG